MVLVFLLSENAKANEKVYLCKSESGVDYLTSITQGDALSPGKMIFRLGTKWEEETKIKETNDRYIAEFDDRTIIFFKRTNLIAETLKKSGNQSFEPCTKVN